MYLFLYALVAQLDRVLDSDSKGRWFESSRAYHVGTDFAPFRFFISIKNQSHAPSFLLFREKSRLLWLCPYRCGHSASAALPTFHECACGGRKCDCGAVRGSIARRQRARRPSHKRPLVQVQLGEPRRNGLCSVPIFY